MDNLFSERRESRYDANLIIDVKIVRWNPFSWKKAKLMDFSKGGFRIEFTEDLSLKNTENIKLMIPLTNFRVNNMKSLKLRAEIKWYDPLHRQVGGTYCIPVKCDASLLEKIISFFGLQKEENAA